jgi:hypothetical protein
LSAFEVGSHSLSGVSTKQWQRESSGIILGIYSDYFVGYGLVNKFGHRMKVKLEHDFAAMSLYRFNCDSELWWTTPWAAYKPLTAEEVKRDARLCSWI